jgi:hypothetical protein
MGEHCGVVVHGLDGYCVVGVDQSRDRDAVEVEVSDGFVVMLDVRISRIASLSPRHVKISFSEVRNFPATFLHQTTLPASTYALALTCPSPQPCPTIRLPFYRKIHIP